jgi:hypothetical protein
MSEPQRRRPDLNVSCGRSVGTRFVGLYEATRKGAAHQYK